MFSSVKWTQEYLPPDTVMFLQWGSSALKGLRQSWGKGGLGDPLSYTITLCANQDPSPFTLTVIYWAWHVLNAIENKKVPPNPRELPKQGPRGKPQELTHSYIRYWWVCSCVKPHHIQSFGQRWCPPCRCLDRCDTLGYVFRRVSSDQKREDSINQIR